MTTERRQDPEWRGFERLFVRIAADAGPRRMIATPSVRFSRETTGTGETRSSFVRGRDLFPS
jgi:hypothetical protein